MRVEKKIVVIFFFTWLVIVSVFFVCSYFILEKSYLTLESQQESNIFKKVNNAFNQMFFVNYTNLKGWTVWDDMYQYVIDKNENFVKTNLKPGAITGFWDMVIIYDDKGNLVYGKQLNQDKSELIPAPQNILNLFNPGGKLRRIVTLPEQENIKSGLLLVAHNLIVFSSDRILPTSGAGPAHGTFMGIYYLDDKAWNKLKTTTGLSMNLYLLPTIQQDHELNIIFNLMMQQNAPQINVTENTIYLYSILKDLTGEPIGLIKINMPREAFLLGKKTVMLLNESFLVISFLTLLLAILLYQILINSRLKKLQKIIAEHQKNANVGIILPSTNKDEIDNILLKLHNINCMEESMESSITKIINIVPKSVIISDKKFKITTINKLAEQHVLGEFQKHRENNLFDLFPYLKKYQDKFYDSIFSGVPKELEKVIYKTKSGIRYFHVFILPFRKNTKSLLITIIEDVTHDIKIQQKLVQTNKLASIGMLTAAVVHEVNNPINFIMASLNPVKNNIENIGRVINQCISEKTKLKSTEISAMRINVKETNELLSNVKEGINRAASIVKGLKMYFQPDDVMKSADINGGIDSTLTLLAYQFKPRIKIIKEYGKIPAIDCISGKINQVFMNIISNAIDSIPNEGEITIKTNQLDNNHVMINIKDNGTGISEENLKNIFNAFFTTKPSGKGTGLGLAISSSIVHDHNGVIEVKSQLGLGTEFIVILPIHQVSDDNEAKG